MREGGSYKQVASEMSHSVANLRLMKITNIRRHEALKCVNKAWRHGGESRWKQWKPWR